MQSKIWLVLGILLLLTATSLAQEGNAEATPSEQAPLKLTIWWPDVLILGDGNTLNPILQAQSDAFVETENNLDLEYRIKPIGVTGGIMSTLRTASNVAPGALPSLTLMRRQDLLTAERGGYLQSMEGKISSAIQGDLDTALALGQVDDVLYGVPYLLELQHMVYRPQNNVDYSSWTYDAVIQRNIPFVFAANRVGGLNDVFYLQYINDGGKLDANGLLTLDQPSLDTTLTFYQTASDNALVDGTVMNYTSSDDYKDAFVSGDYDIALFDSGTYLQLHEKDPNLQIASIPTSSGKATSILNGWVWVLIATNQDEQAAAVRYIDWMMDTNRQAEFAKAIYQIPSRRTAMALGLVGDAPIEPYMSMLEHPILPLSDGDAGSLGRFMQDAFSSVLTAQLTAEDALANVVKEMAE